MIGIYIIAGRNAPEKMGRVGRNIPTAAMRDIREFSQLLVTEMRARVPTWRHYLKSTIRSVDMDRNKVGIKMAYYGPLLETGGPITMITPKLEKWIRDKGGDNWQNLYAAMSSGMYITKPHPFIEPSIRATQPKLNPILRRGIVRAIWRAGFR